MKIASFTIGRDRNGNKILRIKPVRARGFSIQTNGNLPETARNGVCDATPHEVSAYVAAYGTPKQRAALAL